MTLPYRYGWLFGAPNSNLSSYLQKTIRTDLIFSTDRLHIYSSFFTAPDIFVMLGQKVVIFIVVAGSTNREITFQTVV